MTAPLWRRAFATLVPAVAAVLVMVGLIYGSMQHLYRGDANDPQLQMAIDAAARLDAGAAPAEVAMGPPVEMSKSLAVHVTVLNGAGDVIASTALLDGAQPHPPSGLVAEARRSGRDIVTWEPRPGVRCAAVIVPYANGAVLVGRSLQAVEERIDELNALTVAALGVSLILVILASFFGAWIATPRDD